MPKPKDQNQQLRELNDRFRDATAHVKKHAPHLLGSLGKFGGLGQCGAALPKKDEQDE